MSECATPLEDTTLPTLHPVEREDPDARARVLLAVVRGELDSQAAACAMWRMPEVVEDMVRALSLALREEDAQRELLHAEIESLRKRVRSLVGQVMESVPPSASPSAPPDEGTASPSTPPFSVSRLRIL